MGAGQNYGWKVVQHAILKDATVRQRSKLKKDYAASEVTNERGAMLNGKWRRRGRGGGGRGVKGGGGGEGRWKTKKHYTVIIVIITT